MNAIPPAIAAQRRRLAIMLGVTGAMVLFCFAMLVGYYLTKADWMMWACAIGVAVGVGAQIWMIVRSWQSAGPGK